MKRSPTKLVIKTGFQLSFCPLHLSHVKYSVLRCLFYTFEYFFFLLVKGNLPKLALPDGWIALNHRSGGIIYLHKPTRVCTWSRPYHIGGGSVRVTFNSSFSNIL